MPTVSIGTMIEQLNGLHHTNYRHSWDYVFVTGIFERYLKAKKDTRIFTGEEVLKIDRIWTKHFSG